MDPFITSAIPPEAPSQPQREKYIPVAMRQLLEEIRGVEEAISELGASLRDVLGPETPATDAAPQAEAQPTCPLGNELREARLHVHDITGSIKDIQSRLEA